MQFQHFLAALVLAALALGCAGPGSQLTQCQSDKEQLLATIREQRDANRQMHDRLASLESRLDESEKELARQSKAGTRLSSSIPAGPAPGAGLAWKSPNTSSSSSSLTALAATDNRVALDTAESVRPW